MAALQVMAAHLGAPTGVAPPVLDPGVDTTERIPYHSTEPARLQAVTQMALAKAGIPGDLCVWTPGSNTLRPAFIPSAFARDSLSAHFGGWATEEADGDPAATLQPETPRTPRHGLAVSEAMEAAQAETEAALARERETAQLRAHAQAIWREPPLQQTPTAPPSRCLRVSDSMQGWA